MMDDNPVLLLALTLVVIAWVAFGLGRWWDEMAEEVRFRRMRRRLRRENALRHPVCLCETAR